MTTALADDPQFRAAAKRTRRQDIAASTYPAPATADADELQQHQWMLSAATSDATELVKSTARRLYTSLERDLEALAQEITTAGVTHGATTAAARKLLIGDYLLAKTDGYPPPGRFIDRLILRIQTRSQPTRHTALPEPLPLG
ncbi:hypothetical protein ACFWBH_30430 [Streptomyces sp. NPDC059999]|uniref:hypothetical protein n=1 Tax=Streptomyces sp. NPDC059999 TaxID=3347030 RepID=UPI0036894FC6